MHTRWRRPRVAVAPKENLRGGGGGRQRVGPPRKPFEAISQASSRPGPRRGGGAAAARHRRRSHFDFHFLSLGFSCFCGVGLAHTGFFSFPFRLPFPCLLCSFGCLPQVALGFRPRLPRGSLARCFSLFTRGGGRPPPPPLLIQRASYLYLSKRSLSPTQGLGSRTYVYCRELVDRRPSRITKEVLRVRACRYW